MNYELHSAWKKLENSEKRYRTLVENSLQGILILDEYWQYLYANEQCFKIFDLQKHQNSINNVTDYFPRQIIERVDNFFITKTQASLYIDEICLQFHDKQERFVQAILVKTTHKGLAALQIVMYDISHEKVMKKKQKDYEMQLIHNNKMASIGTMVSGVTHEINNPNHMIKQNALILMETWKNITPIIDHSIKNKPNQVFNNIPLSELKTIIPALIEDINNGTKSISGIIEDLKSFVRQDQNQAVKQCSINAVLKDAVHLLRILIQQRCNNFTLELDNNLPDILGYPQRLSQVFINLIVNALESLEDPEKKITVKTFSTAETVSILFKDEGIGVPQQIKKKIFDVFFSSKLDTGGTGLGLSISQSIIVQHHGSIRLNDKRGAGSEFLIQLPINKRPMKITLGLN